MSGFGIGLGIGLAGGGAVKPPNFADLVQWGGKIYQDPTSQKWLRDDKAGVRNEEVYLGLFSESITQLQFSDDLSALSIINIEGTASVTKSGNNVNIGAGEWSSFQFDDGSTVSLEYLTGTTINGEHTCTVVGVATIQESIKYKSYRNEGKFWDVDQFIDRGKVKYNDTVVGSNVLHFNGIDNTITLPEIEADDYEITLLYKNTTKAGRVGTITVPALYVTAPSDSKLVVYVVNGSALETYTLTQDWQFGDDIKYVITRDGITFNGELLPNSGGGNRIIKDFQLFSRGNSVFFDGQLAECTVKLNGVTLLDLPISEGAGTTVHDKSGNGNHVTLEGVVDANTWQRDTTGLVRPSNLLDGCDVWYNSTLDKYLYPPLLEDGTSIVGEGDTPPETGYVWVRKALPSKIGLNGSEVALLMPQASALYDVDSLFSTRYFFEVDGTPKQIDWDVIDANKEALGVWFADVYSKDPIKWNDLIYSEPQTGDILAKILKFIKTP